MSSTPSLNFFFAQISSHFSQPNYLISIVFHISTLLEAKVNTRFFFKPVTYALPIAQYENTLKLVSFRLNV